MDFILCYDNHALMLGEYFINVTSGQIYFYPTNTTAIQDSTYDAYVSLLGNVVSTVSSQSLNYPLQFVNLKGLTIQYTRGTGVQLTGQNLGVYNNQINYHTNGVSISAPVSTTSTQVPHQASNNTIDGNSVYSLQCFGIEG